MALKVGITGRTDNKLAKDTALRAVKILEERGAQIELDRTFFGKGKSLKRFDCDITLSFGGDGTLLQVFRDIGKKIPVMGINCGSLGFLQSYRAEEIEMALEAVLSGKIEVEKRTRILASIDGRKKCEALNEVLIVPDTAGRLLKYKMLIGNNLREEAGDGLIVATPTGSTAHALSAGGPIVRGNAAVFVVVSMNPVDWKHRPLIINDHEKVSISDFRKMKADAIIDGQKRFRIRKSVELVKGSEVLLAVRKMG
ncbi:MAG TPA: NAD(+)/NADH kinase [archaeon]|nr:NAD(+)/NADH kinase [archaeon]